MDSIVWCYKSVKYAKETHLSDVLIIWDLLSSRFSHALYYKGQLFSVYLSCSINSQNPTERGWLSRMIDFTHSSHSSPLLVALLVALTHSCAHPLRLKLFVIFFCIMPLQVFCDVKTFKAASDLQNTHTDFFFKTPLTSTQQAWWQ